MVQVRSGIVWLSVVLIGIILQLIFIFADLKSTPYDTVVNFSKAYFLLDNNMEDYFCSGPYQDNYKNIVNQYIARVSEEASKSGFHINSIRRSLIHFKTETIQQSCDCAQVRLRGISKIYINPVFSWIAKIFNMGKVYSVDESFILVKEDNIWKICNLPFDLAYG